MARDAQKSAGAPSPTLGVPTSRAAIPRLHEQVGAALADLIAKGRIAKGDHLTETAVASRLSVSRAPARHALAALAERGILRKAAGRGFIVNGMQGGASGEDIPAAWPFKVGPIWQHIYDEVESEIAARIAFGSWRITEGDLATAYGVSRTVARDVLGRLQQRGVVEKDERGRWYAPSLTPDRVSGLYEVRSLLEPAALEKAAARAPQEQVVAMLGDLDSAIANPATVDGGRLDKLEHALHVELLGHCQNRALMDAIRSPQSLLLAHRFLYAWTGRMFSSEPFLPEHREVLSCLMEGDATGAKQALAEHLLVSSHRAIARIEAVSSDLTPAPIAYLTALT